MTRISEINVFEPETGKFRSIVYNSLLHGSRGHGAPQRRKHRPRCTHVHSHSSRHGAHFEGRKKEGMSIVRVIETCSYATAQRYDTHRLPAVEGAVRVFVLYSAWERAGHTRIR